jgi:hypothetical protein
MIDSNPSLKEECVRLGAELRLDKPVPDAVYLGALHDHDYARNLFLCSGAPPLLDFLMRNPPGVPGQGAQAQDDQDYSSLELVAKASKSFWAWTKSGFKLVDEAVYERRLSACRACPKLITHPEKAAYALVKESDKICSSCGCVVTKKARMPHETCPVADPDRPGLNRWGELITSGPGN